MKKKELKEELAYAQIRIENLHMEKLAANEEIAKLKNERRNLAFALRLAEALRDKSIYATNVEFSVEYGTYAKAAVDLTGDTQALYDFCMVLRDGA